jgi:hypothetical protein
MNRDLDKYLLELAQKRAETYQPVSEALNQEEMEANKLIQSLYQAKKKQDIIVDMFDKGEYRPLDYRLRSSKMGQRIKDMLGSIMEDANNMDETAIKRVDELAELVKEEPLSKDIVEALSKFTSQASGILKYIGFTTKQSADFDKALKRVVASYTSKAHKIDDTLLGVKTITGMIDAVKKLKDDAEGLKHIEKIAKELKVRLHRSRAFKEDGYSTGRRKADRIKKDIADKLQQMKSVSPKIKSLIDAIPTKEPTPSLGDEGKELLNKAYNAIVSAVLSKKKIPAFVYDVMDGETVDGIFTALSAAHSSPARVSRSTFPPLPSGKLPHFPPLAPHGSHMMDIDEEEAETPSKSTPPTTPKKRGRPRKPIDPRRLPIGSPTREEI